jgi:hypothetical protein
MNQKQAIFPDIITIDSRTIWSEDMQNQITLSTESRSDNELVAKIQAGLMQVPSGAAFASKLGSLTVKFDSPLVVEPGQFIQAVKRKVGTVPGGGTTMHGIVFDGYFE